MDRLDADRRLACRFCGARLELSVVDLGMSPLCESFLTADRLEAMEPFYPLHVRACTSCWLVQLPAFVPAEEIFTEYAYFSAYSTSWVEHARHYVVDVCGRLGLDASDLVVELASNDGYLLQHFVERGIPVLGVDPAANVARAAEERGVRTLVDFFGAVVAEQLVAEGQLASLVVANNVLAQVPDLNDFVAGIAIVLRPGGTVTLEFPHLLRLLDGLQYDTIYHEHFSYFSFATVRDLMEAHGLSVYDVEELASHGGSLRVYAQHRGSPHAVRPSVERMLQSESAEGLQTPERYASFSERVQESKRDLLELLVELRRSGKQVVGYGAPGKGNTLLNFCGIRTDFLDYTVDRNPYKHGRFTPGTHIPIHEVERIAATRPDHLLVLPWNLVSEIATQLAYVADWGGQLIVPIPNAAVIAPGAGAAERLAAARRAA